MINTLNFKSKNLTTNPKYDHSHKVFTGHENKWRNIGGDHHPFPNFQIAIEKENKKMEYGDEIKKVEFFGDKEIKLFFLRTVCEKVELAIVKNGKMIDRIFLDENIFKLKK